VRDRDATLRRGGHVDVVDAGAGLADDPEVGQGVEDVGAVLVLGVDEQGVGAGRALDYLRGRVAVLRDAHHVEVGERLRDRVDVAEGDESWHAPWFRGRHLNLPPEPI
jgi:hypothetical protein